MLLRFNFQTIFKFDWKGKKVFLWETGEFYDFQMPHAYHGGVNLLMNMSFTVQQWVTVYKT